MDLIARLHEERVALVARIAEIDKILKQLDDLGKAARQLIALTNTDAVSDQADSSVNLAGNTLTFTTPSGGDDYRGWVRPTKTPISEFENAVIDVLRETAAPMDRTALYEALLRRGVVIGDGDRDRELNALSARVYRMSQDGRVENVRGKGYRLPADKSDPSVFG